MLRNAYGVFFILNFTFRKKKFVPPLTSTGQEVEFIFVNKLSASALMLSARENSASRVGKNIKVDEGRIWSTVQDNTCIMSVIWSTVQDDTCIMSMIWSTVHDNTCIMSVIWNTVQDNTCIMSVIIFCSHTVQQIIFTFTGTMNLG